jgi:hypothetical protein
LYSLGHHHFAAGNGLLAGFEEQGAGRGAELVTLLLDHPHRARHGPLQLGSELVVEGPAVSCVGGRLQRPREAVVAV